MDFAAESIELSEILFPYSSLPVSIQLNNSFYVTH
jgi:hypothetical protein